MRAAGKRSNAPLGGNRARLHAAGLALFAERGFEGASTHAIAQQAELPQGLIRYHFGSKEGLWREIMTQAASRLAAALSTAGAARLPLADAIPTFAGTQAPFLQCVCHALLEPGERRDWLIAELAAYLQPQARALLASASRGRPRSQEHEVSAWMWLGAAAALAAFGPALERARGAPLDRERALRVQRDLLAAWLPREHASTAAGPWSLAAAARRRAAGARSED